MTDRLEAALKRLSTEELEQVTSLAEFLAQRQEVVPTRSRMKFDWVRALRDRPEKSGLEAQQTAIREWRESIVRHLSK